MNNAATESFADQRTAPQQRTARDRATTRVVLVEDRKLLRGAFAALLEPESDLDVVAAVGGADRIVDLAAHLAADVIVMDLDRTGETGLGVLAELRNRLPRCAVVGLAVVDRPGLLRKALEVGMCGMVDKYSAPGRLAETIRAVAAGDRSVDPHLAVAALYGAANPLTSREIEVLRLAADGASAPEIAKRLSLSGGTVRNYLSRITGKVGARSRIDAIRIASSSGWL